MRGELKTLFDFIFKGMDALGYEEHLDYDIAQSTNPDFNKAIVRVNVFRNHRQTIQVSFLSSLDIAYIPHSGLAFISISNRGTRMY